MLKIDSVPMRILIIEDNEDTSFFELKTFRNLGFEVEYVNHGDLALQKVKEFKPHIIILDLELPGTPGPAIASKILDDDQLKSIPIIVDSIHMSNFKNPEGLDTKYFWAQYQKTGNREPRIIQKSKGDDSLHDLITEVCVACGEVYGVIPTQLMEYFKKKTPDRIPEFKVV